MKKTRTQEKRLMKKTAKKMTKQSEGVEVPTSFAPVVAAFASDQHVTRKRMFRSENVLSVNGKIFVMLVKGNFVAKLPKGRVDKLVSGGNGQYFDPGHGRLMKEWVSIPAGRVDWVELAKEAHRFVRQAG